MIPVIEDVLGCETVTARTILGSVLLAAVAFAAGCGHGTETTVSGRTKVVASFYPLAYAVQEIGGTAVTVENLTPAGAEPHDLELTPRQVRDVIAADLVVYLGEGFQPAVEQAVQQRKGVSAQLLPAGGRFVARRNGDVDPHVWLDPVRFALIARVLGSELDRPRAGAALSRRLRALGREYRRGLAHCLRREIVTSHAAFGYLASRYGLRQVALEGLSPEAEPSPRAFKRLVDEVRATHATTVFFETLVSPKLARTVAREAGVRAAVLDPLEGLTAAEQKRGETYFSVMRRNLVTLRKALACR